MLSPLANSALFLNCVFKHLLEVINSSGAVINLFDLYQLNVSLCSCNDKLFVMPKKSSNVISKKFSIDLFKFSASVLTSSLDNIVASEITSIIASSRWYILLNEESQQNDLACMGTVRPGSSTFCFNSLWASTKSSCRLLLRLKKLYSCFETSKKSSTSGISFTAFTIIRFNWWA